MSKRITLRIAAVFAALLLAFAASPILADEDAAGGDATETEGDTTPPADQDDSSDEE